MCFYLFLFLNICYIFTTKVHNSRKEDKFNSLSASLNNFANLAPNLFNTAQQPNQNNENTNMDNIVHLAPNLLKTATLLPLLDILPDDISQDDMSDVGDANDAMDNAYQTIQNSNLAVQAAVNAIATCNAEGEIDCEQLMKMYNKTQEYINIASNSYQQATSNASKTINISNKTKKALKVVLIHADNKKNKANAKLSDWAARIAQNAVSQAQIAATAVAKASAQCSVIVKIRCNECPTPAQTLSAAAPPLNATDIDSNKDSTLS
jgi:hypothetical protein